MSIETTKWIAQQALNNLEVFDANKANEMNKILLDGYNIPNIGGKFAYDISNNIFFGKEILQLLINTNNFRNIIDCDDFIKELEGK